MSTSRGSGGVVQPIPAGSRKIVQSLKEIVSCSEAEIYATLKDCNMDPNEAVNRLLSQDPFCEVKSKREKKKDATESRPRGATHSTNRGVKSSADRYLRGGSAPYNYSEPAPLHGKSTYKKENGSTPYANSLSSPADMSETTRGRRASGLSVDSSVENIGSSLGAAGGISSGAQQPAAYSSAWAGVPGQVSMADIVKMGRPGGPAASALQHNSRLAEGHASRKDEPNVSVEHPVPIKDEWPSIEKPPLSKVSPIPEYTVDSKVHQQAPIEPLESINQDSDSEEDDDIEGDEDENTGANDIGSFSISGRKISEDDLKGASSFENDYRDTGSYHQQPHDLEEHEVEETGASVVSVTNNLQQLSVEKDDGRLQSDSDAPSVVIPNHLQVQTADCSHLSFGSFGSGMNLAYSSGTMASFPATSNLEQPESEADFSPVEHPDSRNSEYYVGDSHINASDGNLYHRTSASTASYDAPSTSQPEELKAENAEVAHENHYPFPSSNPGYTFDDAQRMNGDFSRTNSQMQNQAPFSNAMQSYPNELQSTLLAANVQPSRESELQYYPFPATQSLSAKYGNTISSIGGSTISMSEALKAAGLSSAQPTAETPSGTSVTTGPPLPQHLAMHPYSQHTLPLGPFTNMMGYPFLPQSYTYMPSAFQQAFAGNTAYHQSLASAGLPQYKNSGSASSLPQSAAVASGYGGAFGNTATIPGNFALNASAGAAAPSGTAISYDDLLNSQYKDNLLSLQQNENAAMWLHGANSRTMSAVPASSYYNYQGQTQQPAGFRQAQQPPPQNYGNLGYPNFYHSQAGMSTLDQPQNPRDGSLGGSQGQPKQSQIWQNSY